MRIYGLKSPVKNLSWLLGSLFFLLIAFYPRFYIAGLDNNPASSMASIFSETISLGGVGWRLLMYIIWRTPGDISWTGRALFTYLAPYCFVLVTLPACSVVIWQRLVYNAELPTVLRGLLAVLLSLICSLLLAFVLDWVGGRVLLHILTISLNGNIEARGLISLTLQVAIAQTVLLLIPCLIIGGALAWWQRQLVLKYIERL